MNPVLLYIASLAAILLALFVFIFFSFIQKKQRMRNSLSLRLLLIKLPQTQKKDGAPNFKEEVNLSEQLFSILVSSKEVSVLEMAVSHVGEEICFYIAVPEKSVEFISRQIEGVFKDAHMEQSHEYNIFQPKGALSAMYLKQSNNYAMPVRTYVESDVDTFSPIVSSFSKIKEVGEGIAIQVLIKPSPESSKKKIISIINELKKGGSLESISSKYSIKLKDIMPSFNAPEKKDEHKPSVVDEEALKTLEKKISKPLIQVNYRVLASAPTLSQAGLLLDGVSGAFSQFEAPLRNKFIVNSVKNLKKFAYQFSFRLFDDSQSMILNTEELAGLFHLPSSSTIAPKIKWLKAKEAPPPADLPTEGTMIGESVFRGTVKPVYITEDDRRRHVYIVGQTGVGKSTLMENMVIEDIKNGKGVAVIDPHGDLVENILGLVPENRREDVIVFDPSEIQRPIGLNMLEYDQNRPEEKTFIVNEIQGIFNKLFLAETMGPMFEQYMRNALLLMMEDAKSDPATMIEIPRIFTDDDYRREKLLRITNPIVVDFWTKEAIKVGGEASLSNMTPYITSKFNNFIANDYVRPIIGQS